ncbi:uncharacterized protein LOC115562891 [Drosophila navojoa]|nr:uncharacterized protein LOC115562891 [Drosophila navojoa]
MQPPISDFDIISIYADISKLSVIERYLNMLYRPSTCFMRLNCYFKLSELECFLADTLYEPEKHTALFIRHTEPPCSLRLYDNGHICCQAYSYKSAALGIHRFIDTMEHLGYSPVFQNPRFNVVNATFCMPFGIDLTILCIEYCEDCDYMPEAHPYLIFKMRNSSTKLAIFNNGCVYVMLSSTPRHTQQAIAYIMPILFRHKDTEKPEDPELRIGDINFKLLWENEFQRQYQNSVNYSR